MKKPHDPQSPMNRPTAPAGDEEAARLLEVGLSDTGGRRQVPPPPAAMAEHFPDFELLEVLGQGGMGVVYKARHRKLDRLVALKVLPRELGMDPAFAERFTREARTLAKLQHPHIVGVYEIGETDGLYYLSMEYVDGVTLRSLMSGRELSAREALAIVPQICDALEYAHREGVVHRDIKPENILLDKGGRVKVADFGLAKMLHRGPGDFTLTGTDQVMGTLHYMAPEQYKTPQDVDHRADIFSLGVVFYEMLTGELPVGNFAKPSDVPDLDARLDEIVMRTLERERDLRYQHASDVKTDVRTLVGDRDADLDGGRGGAGHPPRSTQARRRFSVFTVWALVLIPAAAIIGGGVVAIVDSVGERSIRGDYHAAKAGLWTAFGICGLVVCFASLGAMRARQRPQLVRGYVFSLVIVAVGACGMLGTAIGVASEHNRYMRQRSFERERNRPRPPTPHVTVDGVLSPVMENEIRKDVLETWDRFLRVVAVRDLTIDHAEAAEIYTEEDIQILRKLRETDRDEFERLRKSNELGMGFVGSESLETPLRFFHIQSIQLDRWQRQATVTARAGGVYKNGRYVTPTVAFFMKRTVDGWTFVVDKVRVEEGGR